MRRRAETRENDPMVEFGDLEIAKNYDGILHDQFTDVGIVHVIIGEGCRTYILEDARLGPVR